MLNGIIYQGRDNTIELALTEDGTVINHTAIDHVRLEFAGNVIDSDDDPALFELGGTSKIVLKLAEADITPGTYTARLIVYSVDYAAGLVWMELSLQFLA